MVNVVFIDFMWLHHRLLVVLHGWQDCIMCTFSMALLNGFVAYTVIAANHFSKIRRSSHLVL